MGKWVSAFSAKAEISLKMVIAYNTETAALPLNRTIQLWLTDESSFSQTLIMKNHENLTWLSARHCSQWHLNFENYIFVLVIHLINLNFKNNNVSLQWSYLLALQPSKTAVFAANDELFI